MAIYGGALYSGGTIISDCGLVKKGGSNTSRIYLGECLVYPSKTYSLSLQYFGSSSSSVCRQTGEYPKNMYWVDCSTLNVGDYVWSDQTKTTLTVDGYYGSGNSNSVYYYIANGVVSSIGTCPPVYTYYRYRYGWINFETDPNCFFDNQPILVYSYIFKPNGFYQFYDGVNINRYYILDVPHLTRTINIDGYSSVDQYCAVFNYDAHWINLVDNNLIPLKSCSQGVLHDILYDDNRYSVTWKQYLLNGVISATQPIISLGPCSSPTPTPTPTGPTPTPTPSPTGPTPTPTSTPIGCVPITNFDYIINGTSNSTGFTINGTQTINILIPNYYPNNTSTPIYYQYILDNYNPGTTTDNNKTFGGVYFGNHSLTIIASNCGSSITKNITFTTVDTTPTETYYVLIKCGATDVAYVRKLQNNTPQTLSYGQVIKFADGGPGGCWKYFGNESTTVTSNQIGFIYSDCNSCDPPPIIYTYIRYDVDSYNCNTSNPVDVYSYTNYGERYYIINGIVYYLIKREHYNYTTEISGATPTSDCIPSCIPYWTTYGANCENCVSVWYQRDGCGNTQTIPADDGSNYCLPTISIDYPEINYNAWYFHINNKRPNTSVSFYYEGGGYIGNTTTDYFTGYDLNYNVNIYAQENYCGVTATSNYIKVTGFSPLLNLDLKICYDNGIPYWITTTTYSNNYSGFFYLYYNNGDPVLNGGGLVCCNTGTQDILNNPRLEEIYAVINDQTWGRIESNRVTISYNNTSC
jgi:hypothetical protein